MAIDEEIDVGPGADVEMVDDPSIKKRGRGFDPRADGPSADGVKFRGSFDLINRSENDPMDGEENEKVTERPAQSIEGYIIIINGIDEEATEEEVIEKFSDFGKVQNCHLNLDRRTGYVKGYALVEYETLQQANEAIDACKDGLTLMDKELKAGFAFVQPPPALTDLHSQRNRNQQNHMDIRGISSRGNSTRDRSRSPSRR